MQYIIEIYIQNVNITLTFNNLMLAHMRNKKTFFDFYHIYKKISVLKMFAIQPMIVLFKNPIK